MGQLDEEEKKGGVQWESTCKNGRCQLGESFPCLSHEHESRKDSFCATCVKEGDAVTPMVYITYYGTDSEGKSLVSSAYNPLNFWRWSASSVYDTMLRQVDEVA